MERLNRTMDGGTHEAHAAWYSREAESNDRWQQRAKNVMYAHSAVLAGALPGDGELGALGTHPTTQSLRKGLAASARNAAYQADRLLQRDEASLDDDMRAALESWRDTGRQAAAPTTAPDGKRYTMAQ